MRAVVIVETDQKIGKVSLVLLVHCRDQLFRLDSILASAQHDRRAVCVIGADVIAFMALQSLKACPYIGLNVFNQVAQMYRPVRIRQCTGNEYFSLRSHIQRLSCN